MTVDVVTLAICGVTLILAVAAPYMNVLFRRPKPDEQTTTDVLQPVTVIITSQGNARQLDEHLPIFLTQDYAPGYEVIIVGEKNDTETEDILKRYSGHPHLYTTFIPETSRYMSRKKLAITLGVKAAKNEWVVITNPTCKPNTTLWLATLARHFTESTRLVLGYTNYALSSPPYYRFEHLYTALYIFREALRRRPYRTNCYNMAIRKSVFLKEYGFQGNLKYTISEYDYLVNKFADKHTAVCLHEDSWMTEDTPTKKQWENKHIFLRDTVSHLHRTRRHFLRYRIDQLFLHLSIVVISGTAAYGIVCRRWTAVGVAVIALMVTVVLRALIAKRALEEYAQPLSPLRCILYELSMVWRSMRNRIRYENADKYDFISHKV